MQDLLAQALLSCPLGWRLALLNGDQGSRSTLKDSLPSAPPQVRDRGGVSVLAGVTVTLDVKDDMFHCIQLGTNIFHFAYASLT